MKTSDLHMLVGRELTRRMTRLVELGPDSLLEAQSIASAWIKRDWLTLADMDVIHPQVATALLTTEHSGH